MLLSQNGTSEKAAVCGSALRSQVNLTSANGVEVPMGLIGAATKEPSFAEIPPRDRPYVEGDTPRGSFGNPARCPVAQLRRCVPEMGYTSRIRSPLRSIPTFGWGVLAGLTVQICAVCGGKHENRRTLHRGDPFQFKGPWRVLPACRPGREPPVARRPWRLRQELSPPS